MPLGPIAFLIVSPNLVPGSYLLSDSEVVYSQVGPVSVCARPVWPTVSH